MTDRNDLARPRPDLAGRTGQNQPLDLATSPLPIGRRRRGELDERRTDTSDKDLAGEVKHTDHDELLARLEAATALAHLMDTGTRIQLSLALADALERVAPEEGDR